jgi:hypothetical protein
MAYDSARNRVVLFGGLDYGNGIPETWEWTGLETRQISKKIRS